jgi:hypothetical protein
VSSGPDPVAEALADVIERLEDLAARLERSIDRLSGSSGPTIATDAVPRPGRVQADAAMFYTLSAGDIAAQLGLPATRVSMLLNSACLDLVHRKPELWSQDIYDKTKRRLWHPQTVAYLRDVISDPNHPDRHLGAPYCLRAIEECQAALNLIPRA